MVYSITTYTKPFIFLSVLSLITYYLLTQNKTYESFIKYLNVQRSSGINQSLRSSRKEGNNATFVFNSTNITYLNTTTTTTRKITTIDPALTLLERPPSSPIRYSDDISNATLAVFVFHTQHFVLADLQLFLIRKLASHLVALEVFLDGSVSKEMQEVARTHHARVHSLPANKHKSNAGPSDRNADVVNWALATQGKSYLQNGTAVLLLDGDVFPLTRFDSVSLLNSREIVCRKHPASFARFCWIGFICLAPQLHSTIDEFDVSQTSRAGYGYDAGGKTIEYLLKYQNTSFSWMKETILLRKDKDLFWGAVDTDIDWIGKHFDRCDKCGPEIFYSSFNTSSAVFYHMISASSEWRFGNQVQRRKALQDSILRSPYGSNRTDLEAQLIVSARKIQQMNAIPYHGSLLCSNICHQ